MTTDLGGNVDPTPARVDFKIVKKKKRHRGQAPRLATSFASRDVGTPQAEDAA